jgi:hypothetical protein
MIRIEGITVVAARLAAELKSTKTVEKPHPVPPTADAAKPVSQSLNKRPSPPATGECTRVRIENEKRKCLNETRSNILSVAQNGDASTSGSRGLCGPA